MKTSYFFILLLFFCCNLLGQAPEWVIAVGVEIKYSKTDTEGNIYGVGVFKGTVDFDPSDAVFNLQTSSTKNNMFIVKYNNSGNFVWAKSLGNNENDEAIIDFELYNNELYILGSFNGTVDFDFSSNENNITADNDLFLVKYSTDAGLIWAGSFGGNASFSNSLKNRLDLAINSFDNSLYISGNFSGTADFDLTTNILNKDAGVGRDIFLVKYNLNSELIWCKTAGGDTGLGSLNSISFDADGNVYGAGIASGQNFDLDFSPNENLISSNYFDFLFIVKYDIDGNFISTSEINYSNVETWALSIKVSTNNTVFVSGKSGYFSAGSFFSSNTIRVYNDSLNTLLWHLPIIGPNSVSYPAFLTNLETTSNNDILYGGSISLGTTEMPFLSKYDSNGNSLFINSDLQENDTFTHNQTGECHGSLSSLFLFSDDSFVIFGNLTHTGPPPYMAIDLDISQEGEHYISTNNTYANGSLFFMAKYNSDFSLSTTDYSLLNSLKVFPNPTNSIIYLSSPLLENDGQITLYNILGKEIFNEKVYSPLNNHQIDIKFLESGMYYIKYKTGSNSETKKIIKN